MSDMESPAFTLRDLNRHLAKVLEACDEHGSVEIKSRDGRCYSLQAKPSEVAGKRHLPDFEARHKRMIELGCVPPTPEEAERLDRIIAGEE